MKAVFLNIIFFIVIRPLSQSRNQSESVRKPLIIPRAAALCLCVYDGRKLEIGKSQQIQCDFVDANCSKRSSGYSWRRLVSIACLSKGVFFHSDRNSVKCRPNTRFRCDICLSIRCRAALTYVNLRQRLDMFRVNALSRLPLTAQWSIFAHFQLVAPSN